MTDYQQSNFFWPDRDELVLLLKKNGIKIDSLQLRILGVRTLEVKVKEEGKVKKYIICRQRGDDLRLICPLKEEYMAVSSLWRISETLVPKPLAYIDSNRRGKGPYIIYKFIEGRELGEIVFSENNTFTVNEIRTINNRALSSWHEAAGKAVLPHLSRINNRYRILETVLDNLYHCLELTPEKMPGFSKIIKGALQSLSSPALLHGDPHVYNLRLSPEGLTWIDFERLAVGPPEFDYAMADILLILQSGQLLEIDNYSPGQAACILLLGSCKVSGKSNYYSRGAYRNLRKWLQDIANNYFL